MKWLLEERKKEGFYKYIFVYTVYLQIQLVVVICPTSRDDRYSAIKKLCCVECPIPSQVFLGFKDLFFVCVRLCPTQKETF